MADKNLTEADWKKFAKGRDLKDAGLLKALAVLDKAGDAEDRLKALTVVTKEADALRKLAKSDKEVSAQLDAIDKSIEREEKQARSDLKAAEAQSAADEEEDTPALLTSKMVPLLRMVRKGEPMQALIANAGKEVAVLLSRRPIAPSRRKLLQDYLQASTVKPITGTCLFEENAYTFVVQSQAAGLAKKLKAALLKQVELRLKVRVRGDDGELDDDGEPAEDDADGHIDAAAAAAARAPEGRASLGPAAPDALQDSFRKRMAELEPRALDALRGPRGDASKIRAVAEFAREKGAAGQYQPALQALETLAKLLAAADATPASAQEPDPAQAGAQFNARLAELMPRIQSALKAAGPNAQDIKLKVSESGVFARKKEFDSANRLLDQVVDLLQATTATASHPDADTDAKAGPRAQYEALRARLEPDVLAATTGSDPALAELIAPVRRAWDLALDSADSENFERAALVLQRLADGDALAKLLQARKAGPAAVARMGPSLVQQRKFMLQEWSRMPGELRAQLKGLRASLADAEVDEDPDDLVDGIEQAIEALLEGIQDTMDEAINAGDTGVFRQLRERAGADALMQHLRQAPGIDGGALLATIERSLDRIEQAMLTPA